jgi:hypothetical protein
MKPGALKQGDQSGGLLRPCYFQTGSRQIGSAVEDFPARGVLVTEDRADETVVPRPSWATQSNPMTKRSSQPEQPTPDDSEPSQSRAADKGADGATPVDSPPPQDPDES